VAEKWLTGLRWETQTIEAVHATLANRLERVGRCLSAAALRAHEDVEHVHQFRVATRRATAALELFKCALPGKVFRATRKLLRKFRHAAGAARDWDVFHEMLVAAPELRGGGTPACDVLMGYASARRIDAQEDLKQTVARHQPRFEKTCRELLGNTQKPEKDIPFAEFGELGLWRLKSFIAELNDASGKQPHKYKQLHQLRIIGKRLRYTLELFGDCFAAPLRDRYYPMIEEAQEILGHITDSHIAVERLAALRDYLQNYRKGEWPRFKSGLNALVDSQREQVPAQRERYRNWLPRWNKLLEELPLEELVLGQLQTVEA
jgi:CHAD domain-containing protein